MSQTLVERVAEAEVLLEQHRAERLACETVIRAHPLYPALWHKVATAEAAGLHPVRRRYRNFPSYGWLNAVVTSNSDGSSNWPGYPARRSAYQQYQGSPIQVAYAIAARMVPGLVASGLWPKETLSVSWRRTEAEAYCFVVAQDDIRARIAPSAKASGGIEAAPESTRLSDPPGRL